MWRFPLNRATKCVIPRNHLTAGPHRSPSLNHGFPILIVPVALSYYPIAFSFDMFSAWHTYAPPKLKSRWKWPECLVIRLTLLSWSLFGFITSKQCFFQTVTCSHSTPHRTANGLVSNSVNSGFVYTNREIWKWRRTLGNTGTGGGTKLESWGLR